MAVDDVAITAMNDLATTIRSRTVGDRVAVTVLRDGTELTLEVVLGEDTR
ncbi:MAG: PDZ domain-containing protein [Nitriliruptorales bacterium]